MRKQWLTTAAGFALAIGMITSMGLLTQAGAEQAVVQPGWRFSDGHWNYWDADDGAYYYTDGKHWYTYGDDAWSVYKFDKKFGKKYAREGYVVPKSGSDFVVPSHKIKVKVKD